MNTEYYHLPYIMSFNECRAVLRVGRNTMLRLIHSGQLEAFRIGNRWKITREALIEYIEGL